MLCSTSCTCVFLSLLVGCSHNLLLKSWRSWAVRTLAIFQILQYFAKVTPSSGSSAMISWLLLYYVSKTGLERDYWGQLFSRTLLKAPYLSTKTQKPRHSHLQWKEDVDGVCDARCEVAAKIHVTDHERKELQEPLVIVNKDLWKKWNFPIYYNITAFAVSQYDWGSELRSFLSKLDGTINLHINCPRDWRAHILQLPRTKGGVSRGAFPVND